MGHATFSRWPLYLAAACLLLPAVAGCGGCFEWEDPIARQERLEREAEERRKLEEEARKRNQPPFDQLALRTLPSDYSLTGNFVKAGHWTVVSQHARSTKEDAAGRLEVAFTNREGRGVDLPMTRYRVDYDRPAALPKLQGKQLETLAYVPPLVADDHASAYAVGTGPTFETPQLRASFRDRNSRSELFHNTLPSNGMQWMDARQHLIVIVADAPDRYSFLNAFPTVNGQRQAWASFDSQPYRVVKTRMKPQVMLPSTSFAWTTTAYVIWDKADPNSLQLEQQQALLDWLHWGGQLVINGADSLDLLEGSFLAPYLPARGGPARNLTTEDFAPWTAHWKGTRQSPAVVVRDRPVAGITLAPHAQANEVPHTNGLLYERRIGRGRVVVSAFPLSDSRLTRWSGYDNFLNGAVFRLQGRRFAQGDGEEVLITTAKNTRRAKTLAGWDASAGSMLRYFSRDAIGHAELGSHPEAEDAEKLSVWAAETFQEMAVAAPGLGTDGPSAHPIFSSPTDLMDPEKAKEAVNEQFPNWRHGPWNDQGHSARPGVGVAAWNDDQGLSQLARQTLFEAGGVQVPRASLVLTMLLVYLAALVPLNWLVFRIVGRVEWAWLAAPVISIVAAVAVVRMAQLDIGFVRSEAELVFVEAQGDYSRAHATRYVALYSSLSTEYQLSLPEDDGLILPAGARSADDLRLLASRTLAVRYENGTTLSGLFGRSATTNLAHAEHILNLGQPISLKWSEDGGARLVNGSGMNLRGAGLVRRRDGDGADAGRVDIAWIGDLAAGESAAATFAPWNRRRVFAQWDELELTQTGAPLGTLRIGPLLDMAADPRRLAPGDVRLVAWTDEPPGKITVTPSASQTQRYGVVLVHLEYGALPEPEYDENHPNQAPRQRSMFDEEQ